MKLAFLGRMCSGKSTLAKYMVAKYGYEKYSCAGALKNIAKHIGMIGKDRTLLQNLGYAIRQHDNCFFSNIIQKEVHGKECVVVDDVRYIEEYQALKNEGFVFIKLCMFDDVRFQRMMDMGLNINKSEIYHDSENQIDMLPYDYIITATTTSTKVDDIEQLEKILSLIGFAI